MKFIIFLFVITGFLGVNVNVIYAQDSIRLPLQMIPRDELNKVNEHVKFDANGKASFDIHLANGKGHFICYAQKNAPVWPDLNGDKHKDSEELFTQKYAQEYTIDALIYHQPKKVSFTIAYPIAQQFAIIYTSALSTTFEGTTLTFYDNNFNGEYDDESDQMRIGNTTPHAIPFSSITYINQKFYQLSFDKKTCELIIAPYSFDEGVKVDFVMENPLLMGSLSLVSEEATFTLSIPSKHFIPKGEYQVYDATIAFAKDSTQRYYRAARNHFISFTSDTQIFFDKPKEIDCNLEKMRGQILVTSPAIMMESEISFATNVIGLTYPKGHEHYPILYMVNSEHERLRVGQLVPG